MFCPTMGVTLDNEQMKLETLTKSCKVINDRVRNRFPIRGGLLQLILQKIQQKFRYQYYLEILYKTIFILGILE